MTTEIEINLLKSLEYIPYLDENGYLPESLQGKIGVYAIYNQNQQLQFVGYSRDVYLSLKQHLVRQSDHCYWFKLQTITRPSRNILEEIRQAWITENGSTPNGNGVDEAKWNQPIDAKLTMTEADLADYEKTDELGRMKLLKKIARRLEEKIMAELTNRGVKMEIRFNPKLKEEGLLDLK